MYVVRCRTYACIYMYIWHKTREKAASTRYPRTAPSVLRAWRPRDWDSCQHTAKVRLRCEAAGPQRSLLTFWTAYWFMPHMYKYIHTAAYLCHQAPRVLPAAAGLPDRRARAGPA